MGNTAVMKLPNYGVVCHYLTFQLFNDIFPSGVINIGKLIYNKNIIIIIFLLKIFFFNNKKI